MDGGLTWQYDSYYEVEKWFLILHVCHLFQLPDGKKAEAEINPLFGWELNLSESLGGLEKKTNPGLIQI